MQNLKKLHRKAMRISQEAFVEDIKGSKEKAKEMNLEAFELEKKVALSLKDQAENQPTRAILFRSAAYLALKIENFEEAQELALEGLNHNPPENEKQEFLKILNIVFENTNTITENKTEKESNITSDKEILKKEEPLICTLNVTQETNDLLEEKGYNVYQGSLGKIVKTNNQIHESKCCLPNHDFPQNVLEYDIFIVDLCHVEATKYYSSEHKRKNVKTEEDVYFLNEYPQTIFDSRAYASYLLNHNLQQIKNRNTIVVVFASKDEYLQYQRYDKANNKHYGSIYHSLHTYLDFYGLTNSLINKKGENIEYKGHKTLSPLLSKYKFEYNCILKPQYYKLKNIEPLIFNKDNEVISFMTSNEKKNSTLIFLPETESSAEVTLRLLEEFLPQVYPKLFPYATEFSWLNDTRYYLPNQENFIKAKEDLEIEFAEKIQEKDKEIEENNAQYQFLHDLITATGEHLVKATITFLKWLDFKNVQDADLINEKKDEDIQADISEGLLIIEVKGIHTTSKDSDCSQIYKIKNRRAKERGKFDVYALYIVNHQRSLPPLERENPPFSKNQIEDAKNDERGLLTTWQLFNLYFDIQKGLLSKEEARKCFIKYGLVEFRPENLVLVDEVNEVLSKKQVIILNLNNTEIKVGDILYVELKGKIIDKVNIQSIELNDKNIESANNGEVGVKIDKTIKKGSKVYLKK